MDLRVNKIEEKDLNKAWVAYYSFFESLYGKSFLGFLTKNALERNEEVSPILEIIDNNYNLTKNAFLSIDKINLQMLGIYDEKGLVAVGRIKINESNALVGEIILIDRTMEMNEELDIYAKVVEIIEKFVIEKHPEIDTITLEIPSDEMSYLFCVIDQGYELEKENKNYFTVLLNKPIKQIKKSKTIENN